MQCINQDILKLTHWYWRVPPHHRHHIVSYCEVSISGSSKILVVFICSYLLGDDPTRKARSISIKDVGWILIKSGMFIAMGTLQDCRQTAMLQLHGRDDDVMPSAGRGRGQTSRVGAAEVSQLQFLPLTVTITPCEYVSEIEWRTFERLWVWVTGQTKWQTVS